MVLERSSLKLVVPPNLLARGLIIDGTNGLYNCHVVIHILKHEFLLPSPQFSSNTTRTTLWVRSDLVPNLFYNWHRKILTHLQLNCATLAQTAILPLQKHLHHVRYQVASHIACHATFCNSFAIHLLCRCVAIAVAIAVAMGQSHGGVGVRKRRISLTSRQSLTSNESEWSTDHSIHKDRGVGKSLRLY